MPRDGFLVLKVHARSTRHLEEVTGRTGTLGSVTSGVVHSSSLPPSGGQPLSVPAARWTTAEPCRSFTTSS